MSKHTPGPWKVATTYKLAQRGAAEIVPWNDQGRTLALTQTVKGYSPDESLANARLIAAAPDMLEVLKKLDDLRNEWRNNDNFSSIDYMDEIDNLAEDIRAAIAKAEGK